MDTSGLTEIQTLQEKINKLIRHGQVQAVNGNFEKHSLGSKSWWSTVNPLKCRKPTNTPISLIISLNEINNFFVLLTLIPLINQNGKESAYDLALVVNHIFNCSLENHTVSDL